MHIVFSNTTSKDFYLNRYRPILFFEKSKAHVCKKHRKKELYENKRNWKAIRNSLCALSKLLKKENERLFKSGLYFCKWQKDNPV